MLQDLAQPSVGLQAIGFAASMREQIAALDPVNESWQVFVQIGEHLSPFP